MSREWRLSGLHSDGVISVYLVTDDILLRAGNASGMTIAGTPGR